MKPWWENPDFPDDDYVDYVVCDNGSDETVNSFYDGGGICDALLLGNGDGWSDNYGNGNDEE